MQGSPTSTAGYAMSYQQHRPGDGAVTSQKGAES